MDMDLWAYLCDGEEPCQNSINCYKQGGLCRHTLNKEHAKNKDWLSIKWEKVADDRYMEVEE